MTNTEISSPQEFPTQVLQKFLQTPVTLRGRVLEICVIKQACVYYATKIHHYSWKASPSSVINSYPMDKISILAPSILRESRMVPLSF